MPTHLYGDCSVRTRSPATTSRTWRRSTDRRQSRRVSSDRAPVEPLPDALQAVPVVTDRTTTITASGPNRRSGGSARTRAVDVFRSTRRGRRSLTPGRSVNVGGGASRGRLRRLVNGVRRVLGFDCAGRRTVDPAPNVRRVPASRPGRPATASFGLSRPTRRGRPRLSRCSRSGVTDDRSRNAGTPKRSTVRDRTASVHRIPVYVRDDSVPP